MGRRLRIIAFVLAGGLMSYGVSWANELRNAATYIDRILRGTPQVIAELNGDFSNATSPIIKIAVSTISAEFDMAIRRQFQRDLR
jgi:hypothetical protein